MRPDLPVTFLVHDLDARNGVSRSVLNLANGLAEDRPVRVLSLYRRARGPAYPVDARVQVTYLFDHPPVARPADGPRRPAARYRRRLGRHPFRNRLARRPSALSLGFGFPNYSRLTDQVLADALGALTPGVLVSTRPALHVAAARLTGPEVVTVAQDHLNFESRRTENGSLAMIELAAREGLDAFVTLTRADAEDYAALLAPARTRIRTIPNALSWPVAEAHQHGTRTIVSAGRLVPRKGFGRLIRAFAPVARQHPDWRLAIYGQGRLGAKLGALVTELGLDDQVTLAGYTDDLPGAFDEASVFASASAAEGFPMVMLEALSKGLPIVGFDCPRGPSDIIRDGRNGLLVANGDVRALSAALETVVADDVLRRSMSAEALADAEQYLPVHVAARWADLFDELAALPGTAVAPAPRPHPITA